MLTAAAARLDAVRVLSFAQHRCVHLLQKLNQLDNCSLNYALLQRLVELLP
jgi:hypothetical protein